MEADRAGASKSDPSATAAVDACIVIAAFEPKDAHHEACRKLLEQGRRGAVSLTASVIIVQQVRKSAAAAEFVRGLPRLPHHPVGTLAEQGPTTVSDCDATWEQLDLAQAEYEATRAESLMKGRADREDRAAYVDAARAGCRWFVTTDDALVNDRYARRLADRFETEPIRPDALLLRLEIGGG
jgi:hypothetical protein